MRYLILIVVAANVIALVLMGADKRRAAKNRSRISEARLIAPVAFGGLAGVLLGMLLFRHKTKKRSFQGKLLLATILFAGIAWVIYSRGSVR